jgi:hypothetical protein
VVNDPIPPVAVSYRWECTLDGQALSSGVGSTATVSADSAGTLTCKFYANASRECPPTEISVGQQSVDVFDVELEIVSLSPSTSLKLGEDMQVDYTIEDSSGAISGPELRITNRDDVVIYAVAVPLASGAGSHTWSEAKWSEAPHSGAFANPGSGPYSVQIVAMIGTTECRSNALTIDTKLELVADVTDHPAPSSPHAAGLEHAIDGLEVAFRLGSRETILMGPGDLELVGQTREVKTLRVFGPRVNQLPPGDYEVLFRNLRDDIGNFYDDDSSQSNGIQPKKHMISLF